VAALLAALAAELDPGGNLMLEAAGVPLPGEIGLVDEIVVVGLPLAPFAADGHLIERIARRG
jgi:hypothetical protein